MFGYKLHIHLEGEAAAMGGEGEEAGQSEKPLQDLAVDLHEAVEDVEGRPGQQQRRVRVGGWVGGWVGGRQRERQRGKE